jgi:C-terminal processing protease CtpA/Prc
MTMMPKVAVTVGMVVAGLTALAYSAIQPGNIGIAISRTNAGEPVIGLVFPHSPAEAAGVKTNWFIISVDGTKVVSGAASEDGMSMVHGVVGTFVTLELADPQRRQTNSFTIKRADVRIPDDLFPFLHGSDTNAPKPIAPKSPLIAQ